MDLTDLAVFFVLGKQILLVTSYRSLYLCFFCTVEGAIGKWGYHEKADWYVVYACSTCTHFMDWANVVIFANESFDAKRY